MKRQRPDPLALIAAVLGGLIAVSAVWLAFSEVSPFNGPGVATDFSISARNFLVMVTLPAIMIDLAFFDNPHQFFHWIYYMGVFAEGALVSYVLAALGRRLRLRSIVSKRDVSA